MLRRPDAVAVMSVALCGLILVGALVAYVPGLYTYGADAEISDGTCRYTAESSGSQPYSVVVLSHGGLPAVDDLRIYIDPTHEEYYREAYEGSRAYGLGQEYYAEQIMKLASIRGFHGASECGPSELSDYLESTMSNPYGHGVMVMTYALPAEVYSGSPSDPILEWVRAGGTLFWMSSEIGRYYVDGSGLHETHGGQALFLGGKQVNVTPRDADRSSSDLTDALSIRSGSLMFSIPADGGLALGFGDGEYSSIVFTPLGKGAVCVLGGGFDMNQLDDLGQILGAGVNLGTSLVSVREGTTDASGELEMGGGDSVYIYIGGTYARYGEDFRA